MKFQITATEYLNTGGNCMVTICDVLLLDEFRTAYVYVGDDFSTIVSIDFIRQDVDVDSYECVIDAFDYWDDEAESNYFEIHRQCVAIHLANERKYPHNK